MLRSCPNCRRLVYNSSLMHCGYCGRKLTGNLFSESYVDSTLVEPNRMPAHIKSIWERLEALKTEDRKFKVFGASKHRYHSSRVSEDEMLLFEDWCGVTLPSSYRDYLLHIGHGMGPYYGIWSPPESRSEFQDLLPGWELELGPKPCPSRPFPYTIADAQTVRSRQAAGEKEPWITSTWPIDGCVPICHQGCTYWTVLVVTGECAG